MKLTRAAELVQGQMKGQDVEFQRVSTDTRAIEAGDLFVALRGENFDAHDFLARAADAGACAAVAERDTDAFGSYVRVEDCRRALGLLAAGWCDQFDIRRLAVTGNAGKTTVKEMIACMLGEGTHATQGNLNNDIGVPLTLLDVTAEHRYGVFELGANAPGEIAWTASLVKPEVALVTNVTGAHLEGFGSMEGIARAKAEIFSGMAAGGTAIINQDDLFAGYFAEQAEQRGLGVIRVGESKGAELRPEAVQCGAASVDYRLMPEGLDVHLELAGRHQVSNSLMAIAAVWALGVPLTDAVARLAELKPVAGRMQHSYCLGGTLVDDTYNASPGAVRAAIDWLALQKAPRVLVLGSLAELGEQSAALHRELGEYARQQELDGLIVTDGDARVAGEGFGEGAFFADSRDEATELAARFLEAGGTVLVKGSRSAHMETVTAALRERGRVH